MLDISVQRHSQIISYRFTSDPPQTPYCPQWDYIIAEKTIDIDVEELTNLILSKRHKTLPNDQGDILLLNPLKWNYPVCKNLLNEIKKFHKEYVKNTFPEFDSKLKVRCWCIIMDKGQHFSPHFHSIKGTSYLSGHFTVKCDGSSTNYRTPYELNYHYPIKNVPNVISLFPTCIVHNTTPHQGDSERITIAFDLILENTPLDHLQSFADDNNSHNNENELIFI